MKAAVHAIPMADLLVASMLYKVAAPKSKATVFIASGHKVYLTNPSEVELQLPCGFGVCEFYNGKWSNTMAPTKREHGVLSG